jgi:hypothetical protein
MIFMNIKNLKAIAVLTGAFCAASLMAPAMSRADEAKNATAADAAKTLQAITAGGTRAGAPDTAVHIMPTQSAALNLPSSVLNRTNFYGYKQGTMSPEGDGAPAPSAPPPAFPAPFHWSKAFLYNYGGNGLNHYGVTSANQVNAYVNCAAPYDHCWGNGTGAISTFQDKLNASTFIHVVDQYVKTSALLRYPRAGYYWHWYYPFGHAPWGTPTMLDSDAQAIAEYEAKYSNTFGYGYIFHVFVPQGTDVCFDKSYSQCYSPDHGSTFYFCGYHGSFTDGSGHHIMYSVEPYDAVSGCMESGMSNTDAQVNVLSHETFEWITDPDPNHQWNTQYYGEIGDACAWGSVAHLSLAGYGYNVQEEVTDVSGTCWDQANN